MRKLFIGMVLLLASVFTVAAADNDAVKTSPVVSENVSFGVGFVGNLHANQFGAVVSAYDVLIDRIGVYGSFNIDARMPEDTMYNVSLGGNIRVVDNFYLFAGAKTGIQSVSDERVEVGAEYFVFDTVGLKIKADFPNFDVDNVYLGVGFRI